MSCPSCGQENRETARFCGECAAPLGGETPCPQCGAANPAGQKFCDSCASPLVLKAGLTQPNEPAPRNPRDYTPNHLADKILQSKSALEGERKQVTVLFADVKGSMDLAAVVDPEEWHLIMDRFFAILADGVHRFEGTVNQFTGDGIMALFGAPIAHEDHAQRGCYAALQLGDALRGYSDELRLERGLSFSVRMGLNSGEVVVGKIGDDLRMDYTAQGPTVGLAARMEQIAEPGRVYLTGHTARLVEGFFQLRDLGESRVKGAAEPLRVFELEGVGPLRSRLERSRARGFLSFVGRTEELSALETALQRSSAGSGQVVGVVGEAGLGKSRLCLEFVERIRARGTSVWEAHCPSHGQRIPFLPVLEMFRSYFEISEQDPAAKAREKIAGRLLLLDRSFDEVLPALFELLGVANREEPALETNAELRQRQLFGFVRRLVRNRDDGGPGVIFVDDVHWIDPSSDAFLTQLVEAVSGSPTLLLLNFRPEYHRDWMSKSYYQQLPLLPLRSEEIDCLLGKLLGTDSSVLALPALICERTGGNPFFIEEVVQSLVEKQTLTGKRGAYRLEHPLETLEIPASVQSLLASRIDRLGEREKYLLQTAAVIGKRFSEPILREVIELPEADLAESLSRLQSAEFVYEEAIYPHAEYAFKHPLTHEVAYGSQLAGRRARQHVATARAIVELQPERLGEQAALIAHHWEQAGEALEAARWRARAAEWVGVSDVAESMRHWKTAYEQLQTLPDEREAQSLRLQACIALLGTGGWRLGLPPEEEEALFTDGRALADRLEDDAAKRRLTTARAIRSGVSGDAQAYLEQTLALAQTVDESADRDTKAASFVGLVYAHHSAGKLAESLEHCERGIEFVGDDIELGHAAAGFSVRIWLLHFRGELKAVLGDLAASGRDLERATELAREHGELENLCWALLGTGSLAQFSGERRDARLRAHEALQIAEKLGTPFSLVFSLEGVAQAATLEGEWDEAIENGERALEIARTHRTALEGEASMLSTLALAYSGAGRVEPARARADEALEVARRSGATHREMTAHLALAQIRLRAEDVGARVEIEASLSRALELVHQTGLRSYEPIIVECRAELAGLLGDESERETRLREAHRLYVEVGAAGHAERLARELATAAE